MITNWIWALGSVLVVSLASLIGVFTLGIKSKILNKVLLYLVAFSAGALLGDVFLHLMPEMLDHAAEHDLDIDQLGLLIIGGIVIGLLVEKVLHWHHCHKNHEGETAHTLGKMNLFGDFIHNLIDGLIIGASFSISIPAGIATSLAVLFHEIPQEIGDFAVLIHDGYSKKKALVLNFLSALSAVIGAILALSLGEATEGIHVFIIPIAMGMFIYIAGTDLIPEIHKHKNSAIASTLQIIFFLIGVVVMFGLLLLEGHSH